MISRALLIADARLWLGTKWVHQGRVHGVGVDCIGLLTEAAKSQGLELDDRRDYPREPNGELLRELERQFDPLPSFEDAHPGDVLVFWFSKRELAQHVGIKTDRGMIHTQQACGRENRGAGRVVETNIGEFWEPRKHSAWAYRGIEPWRP